jgi:hypothetical protein
MKLSDIPRWEFDVAAAQATKQLAEGEAMQ